MTVKFKGSPTLDEFINDSTPIFVRAMRALAAEQNPNLANAMFSIDVSEDPSALGVQEMPPRRVLFNMDDVKADIYLSSGSHGGSTSGFTYPGTLRDHLTDMWVNVASWRTENENRINPFASPEYATIPSVFAKGSGIIPPVNDRSAWLTANAIVDYFTANATVANGNVAANQLLVELYDAGYPDTAIYAMRQIVKVYRDADGVLSPDAIDKFGVTLTAMGKYAWPTS